MEGANMDSIMQLAKKISADMNIDKDTKNVDMSQIIKHVTQSVSKIVTPEFVSKMNGNGDNMITMKKSHNKSKSKPRHKTKDIEYNLDVTLEDIYFGKQKKIGVRVKRVNESGEYIDEKIKLVVDIKPGMRGGEIVKFEGQSDHREGYLQATLILI